MANINIDYSNNFVFRKQKTTKTVTYQDIGTANMRLYTDDKGVQRLHDVNTSNYDLAAIKSAIRNIFRFRKGQAILEPEFGNDLYQYLYETASVQTGDKIAKTARQMLTKWQPRIQISNMNSYLDLENATYYLEIEYFVPTLHNQIDSITVSLNQNDIAFS